jgi:hypothetical protein
LQWIGGGADRREPLFARKVDISDDSHFPSLSTRSKNSAHRKSSLETKGFSGSDHRGGMAA